MIDELRAMAIFAETAKKGSFRLAAKTLGLSPSVVSYHISRLEKSLETPLLYRTTRNLSLTHEGQMLYLKTNEMLSTARSGLAEISASKKHLHGKLSITLPTALTRHPISQGIASFASKHPELTLQLEYTDQRQHIVEQGIDLAIRAGELPDSSLKSRRIGFLQRKLVCASTLYATLATPDTPLDVQNWPWVHLTPMPRSREIVDPEGKRHKLHFTSKVTVNNVEAMTELCIQGQGVATPPVHLAKTAIEKGQLIEICPTWQVPPIALYAVRPNNTATQSAVRKLLDYLCEIDFTDN